MYYIKDLEKVISEVKEKYQTNLSYFLQKKVFDNYCEISEVLKRYDKKAEYIYSFKEDVKPNINIFITEFELNKENKGEDIPQYAFKLDVYDVDNITRMKYGEEDITKYRYIDYRLILVRDGKEYDEISHIIAEVFNKDKYNIEYKKGA